MASGLAKGQEIRFGKPGQSKTRGRVVKETPKNYVIKTLEAYGEEGFRGEELLVEKALVTATGKRKTTRKAPAKKKAPSRRTSRKKSTTRKTTRKKSTSPKKTKQYDLVTVGPPFGPHREEERERALFIGKGRSRGTYLVEFLEGPKKGKRYSVDSWWVKWV